MSLAKKFSKTIGFFLASIILNVLLLIATVIGVGMLTDIHPECRSEVSETIGLFAFPVIVNLTCCVYFYKRNKVWAIVLLITMFVFVICSNVYLKRGCSGRLRMPPVDQSF